MKTQFANLTGHSRFFGYVGPHGGTVPRRRRRELDGDLRTVLAGGMGKRFSRQREMAAMTAADDAGQIGLVETTDYRFSPRHLTGIRAWFDATQMGPVSPGTIYRWPDLIANNDAVAFERDLAPAYEPAGINGLPVVAFAGDEGLVIPYSAFTDPGVLSLFIVVKIEDLNDAWALWYSEGFDGGYYLQINNPRSMKGRAPERGPRSRQTEDNLGPRPRGAGGCVKTQLFVGSTWVGNSNWGVTAPPVNLVALTIGPVDGGRTPWSLKVNNETVSGTPSGAYVSAGAGGDIWLAGWGSPADPLHKLRIGEMVLVGGILSDDDLAALRAYFSAKWGTV